VSPGQLDDTVVERIEVIRLFLAHRDPAPFAFVPFREPGVGVRLALHPGQDHPVGQRQRFPVKLTAADDHNLPTLGAQHGLFQ